TKTFSAELVTHRDNAELLTHWARGRLARLKQRIRSTSVEWANPDYVAFHDGGRDRGPSDLLDSHCRWLVPVSTSKFSPGQQSRIRQFTINNPGGTCKWMRVLMRS